MTNTLYVSGCSNSHHLRLDSYKDSWTSQLGFTKVYNHSVCGGSNDFITRQAIDFCSRHKPDLAIIQWTQLPRSESFGPEGYGDLYTEQRSFGPEYSYLGVSSKDKVSFYEWSQHFKPDFYANLPKGSWIDTPKAKAWTISEDATTSLFGLIKNAYILQSFFKENNQPYLFVNGGDLFHATHFGYQGEESSWYPLSFIDNFVDGPITAIQPLANMIDKTYWPNVNIMENEIDTGNDGTHGGPITNKAFAEKVKSYLQNVNNR